MLILFHAEFIQNYKFKKSKIFKKDQKKIHKVSFN